MVGIYMRTRTLAFILLVTFVASGLAYVRYERATIPTGQCATDSARFYSQLEDIHSALPAYDVLKNQWRIEMVACEKSDSVNREKYIQTVSEIDAEVYLRFEHYIKRHSMVDQFLAEDEQGEMNTSSVRPDAITPSKDYEPPTVASNR